MYYKRTKIRNLNNSIGNYLGRYSIGLRGQGLGRFRVVWKHAAFPFINGAWLAPGTPFTAPPAGLVAQTIRTKTSNTSVVG